MKQWVENKPRLQLIKEWLFQFFFTIDTNRFTNPYAQLFSLVMQLSALHYFYINPIFTFLNSHTIFNNYFQNLRQYFIHIYAFDSPTLALLTLLLYPIVIVFVILVKKFGPNKLLIPIVQISIYIYPLLWIKIMIELISGLRMGQYLYIVLPFGILNLIFGGALLLLEKKAFRMLEFILVLFLELHANIYAIIITLIIRLAIQAYLLYSAQRSSLGFYFELSLMVILVTSPFCDDQFLNIIGFITLALACLSAGANEARRAVEAERSILYFADLLKEEDEEEAIFEVYRRVEEHHVRCDLTDCLCHEVYQVNQEELTQWVYRFQEQRLRRNQSLQGRLQYAERCWSHYDYKLNGLVRVCEGKARGVLQQYQIFRVCCIYELNLRKQDKNYRYGEPYRNSQEQLQIFHTQLANILAQIRKFWSLITSFDGSTKFLSEILLISHAITKLREQYQLYVGKYDDELKEFKYAFELFLSIILNEQIAEQDDVLIPDPSAFLITNGSNILNANNAFLALTSQKLDTLVGHPYHFLIPDVYKDIHKKWANDFIEKVQEYQEKNIQKCLSLGSVEIKMVEMEHRVLPRFLEGLEIFTLIRMSQGKEQKRESFVFLAQKQTFYIKNVQSTFFDAVKFKVSQRNFKLLQEMSLTSIFENFTTNQADNPTREVAIFPHFLQEFTFTKSKRKNNKPKTLPASRASSIIGLNSKLILENEQFFEFTILPNNRAEDPYVKVRFTVKEQKIEDPPISQESLSRNQQEQNLVHQKPKKLEKYGFIIPYYLLAILGICHIFYSFGRGVFDNAISDLQNRYQFYLDFDYTTLHVLSAQTGIDYTEELRGLWINGYGDFSESFNAFRRVKDPYFLKYFNSKITEDFHNQLFLQIQSKIKNAIQNIRFYQVLVMVTLIIVISYAVFDLLLSLRYTIFIESKVGALLLQFVIIESSDVKQILTIIDSFQSSILNAQENQTIYRVPIEVGEESAFELMKGGGYSLNNSMVNPYQQDQQTPKQHSHHPNGKRRGSSMDRVSLTFMKEEFKTLERSAFKRESVGREEYKEEKNRNINLFKRRYRSCGFIIGANKFLFFLIFSGFIIIMIVLCISFIFLYTPFNNLPIHLQALDNLHQTRIILLKSQTEILINSPNLQPPNTLSNTLLTLINLISSISSTGSMSQFNSKFTAFMNTNVCSQVSFNCSLLSNDHNLHEYGIKVISQYLENYFRQQNITALTTNNMQNQYIFYTEVLFTQLINDFVNSSQSYCMEMDVSELRMMILGSLGLLLGLILSHYSLRQFKDRIENSRNLLQIIPKEIKKKQEKEIDELTLKELSTP